MVIGKGQFKQERSKDGSDTIKVAATCNDLFADSHSIQLGCLIISVVGRGIARPSS